MKKILPILIFIIYILLSITFIKYFKVNELYKIETLGNRISIKSWSKDVQPKDKLIEINNLAINNKINIYKLVYNPKINNEKQEITIYVAIGDKERFSKDFNFKKFSGFSSNEQYISSKSKNDKNQIETLKLFNKDIIVNLKPIIKADKENIAGEYSIETDNNKLLNDIRNKFQSEIGFEIGNTMEESGKINLNINVIDAKMITIFIILFMFLSLSFMYYIVLDYKNLAIKKMFGFSNRELIFKVLMKYSVTIHLLAMIIEILSIIVYLIIYNDFSKGLIFIAYLFLIELIFILISNIIIFFICLIVNYIEIASMLKNKKQIFIIQILNYMSKLIFSICLLTMLSLLYTDYKELMNQNSNMKKWESTANYSFYEMQFQPLPDQNENEILYYELGNKCRELIKSNNEDGILIRPSDSIAFRDMVLKNEKSINELDANIGNNITVNGNYLNENAIYDISGNRVIITSEYGDSLMILVPEKYKSDEDAILKNYTEWYQFSRYSGDDAYNKAKGIDINKHPSVSVTIKYIKNNQKCFLYDPNIFSENKNYVTDPIIILANSENMGSLSYLHFMSAGRFYSAIKNPKKAYEELLPNIQNAGLESIIFSTPTVYSRVDSYMNNLHNEILLKIFIGIILLITEIIICIFVILNHCERNKLINTIKKINGFSFIKIHFIFFIVLFLSWIITEITITIILKTTTFITSLYFIIPCFVIECIISSVIIKLVEKKKVLNVLKGD